MALIVIEDSTVGVTPIPSEDGGFAIQLKDIPGFPDGLAILVPFEGETAEQMYDQIGDVMGRTATSPLATATPADAAKEASRHGFDPTI